MSAQVSHYVRKRVNKFLSERRARRMGEVPYYEVDSDSGHTYKVFLVVGEAVCTCEAGRYRQGDPAHPVCSHAKTALEEEYDLG